MVHLIPWGVCPQGLMREGLVTLTERMDLDVSGERATRAYVALRMLTTRFGRALPEHDQDISLSREATVALVEELATMPALGGLRAALLTQLQEEPEDASPRVSRPNRVTVRESRNLSFQC